METNLHTCFDAKVWAKEFMKVASDKSVVVDEDLMVTWFANAIMTGFDHARVLVGEKEKEIE